MMICYVYKKSKTFTYNILKAFKTFRYNIPKPSKQHLDFRYNIHQLYKTNIHLHHPKACNKFGTCPLLLSKATSQHENNHLGTVLAIGFWASKQSFQNPEGEAGGRRGL
eukprot:TRINITY_DN7858_c0_g1_i7.p1 TRINITY_DN7858_c0_g1~~TRINITY_DN7858_c0_g1_i7.p1  ORF type:complete len:109 (+),score=6.76 TRINITY_DN7858_c0_g1_i7:93-419(+)